LIEIEVRIFATLRKYVPGLRIGEALRLTLKEGTAVRELIENELGIPPEAVKNVFVNGAVKENDHVLNSGDRVGIFPPIAGG
jgi:molybdopterin synthase sulfur carrier subunit